MTSRAWLGVAAIAVAGLALVWAGCGEGGGNGGGSSPSQPAEASESGGTVTTSSLSRATYAEQATAACRREGQRILAGLATQHTKTKPGEFEIPVSEELSDSVLIPSVEKELAELRELGAPEGKQVGTEALLRALQTGIESDKEREVSSLADFGKGFRRFDEIARKLSLSGCIFGLG